MWLNDLEKAIEAIKAKFPTLPMDGTINKIVSAQNGIIFYTSFFKVIYWHFDGTIEEGEI